MASPRKVLFVNGEVYHVFNRGIDGQPIFTSKWDYHRALETVDYYRFANIPIRYSLLSKLPYLDRQHLLESIHTQNPRRVDILSYCLMPNHYHLLLRQNLNKGISGFISEFSNSYSRYFNIRKSRKGHLFQNAFQAVRIETEEQLLHVSRYIHLNPVSSFLIKEDQLDSYPWSSLSSYLHHQPNDTCLSSLILSLFNSPQAYHEFIHNRIDFAQKLNQIKHLSLEQV